MTGQHVVAILRQLEGYYETAAEDVVPFLREDASESAREQLLLRENHDGLEMALILPTRVATAPWAELSLDERCQRVEGASHFLLLCDRARQERSTTQLELELQAEVDKWLVLSQGGALSAEADALLRQKLFEEGAYLHGEETDLGARYRLANQLARKLTRRLSQQLHGARHEVARRRLLRAFFQADQHDKLRLAGST